ncbi:hypothetical protein B0G82_1398 [Paraburkholderia sp. BL17N1]|nr:hypothetical protein B0G82_1398 [Paraburkholderia sp. BL17N1]
MKRFGVALIGSFCGLFLTWACLYALSHAQWLHRSNESIAGCHELGKCAVPWRDAVLLLAYLLGPAVLLGLVNAVAWKRWSALKWAGWFFGITILTVALYATDYSSAAF